MYALLCLAIILSVTELAVCQWFSSVVASLVLELGIYILNNSR